LFFGLIVAFEPIRKIPTFSVKETGTRVAFSALEVDYKLPEAYNSWLKANIHIKKPLNYAIQHTLGRRRN
jgi:hypothetical protein